MVLFHIWYYINVKTDDYKGECKASRMTWFVNIKIKTPPKRDPGYVSGVK